MPIKEQLSKYAVQIPESSCVFWTGTILKKSGYGQLTHKNIKKYVHIVAYELNFGKIPDGKKVCHSCDNRICINPNHLWLGTQKQNIQDAVKKNRMHNNKKTHCPKGHEYSVENTIYEKTKQNGLCRKCKKCRSIYHQNRHLKKHD